MRTAHTVTTVVNVTDRRALWDAAFLHATSVDEMTPKDARDFLGHRSLPCLSACLSILFDPGISPPGTSIIDVECSQGIDLD